jgi:acetyl esterase/lipase
MVEMLRIALPMLFVACLCAACSASAADNPVVLNVWPGKTPADTGIGQYGPITEERFRPPNDSPTTTAKWLTGVTKPTITIYRPAKDKDTGAAMIICPGGGYWNLAWDLEGTEVAEWLNSAGITGVVLKYRVPRRKGEPEALPAPGPLLDAQRAISLVRSKARELGIDPNRIGIVGFSAGGHLAIAAATNFRERAYDPIDAVDKESCRPDFAVAVYPGYLATRETGLLAPHIRIPRGTPPIMLIHAADDPEADVENSVQMFRALKKVGSPVEMHVYQTGGHGFGVRKTDKACSRWTESCLTWLHGLTILK